LIEKAYAVLTDKDSREKYDTSGEVAETNGNTLPSISEIEQQLSSTKDSKSI
jgi:DnaJ-class molecular chaperone